MQSPRTSVPTTSAKAFTTKDQVDAKVSVNIHSSTPSSTPSSTTSKPETKPHQSAAAKNFFAKNNIGKNSIEKKVSANPMQPKHDASNIFKSFAKAKPKLKREGTDSSAGFSGVDSPAISAAEDDVMKDVSDDEEDTFVVPVQNPKDFSDSKRKSREEKAKEAKRKAALEKMMEENDTEDAPNSAPEVDEVEDQKLEDVKANGPVAETTEVKGGRRRGRRKVKKTVTTRDDEGYLGK
jgi:DNA polymerase delta subunit 3